MFGWTCPRVLLRTATAETVRATRHVLFVRGVAHHGDPSVPVAVATATFAVTSSLEQGGS